MNYGTSIQWNIYQLSKRGTLCTVLTDGQDILNENANYRIIGIVSYHVHKTTINKSTKEYVIVYACKSTDYL